MNNRHLRLFLILNIICCCWVVTACNKQKIVPPPTRDTARTPPRDTSIAPVDTTKAPADTTKPTPADTLPPAGDDSLTYLALGDSYTIGQSVATKERFPAQTIDILNHEGLKVKAPRYIATTGWTTFNLIDAINWQTPPSNFSIVTLLIGVNDQYQHRETNTYGERFETLLKRAIVLAGGNKNHVFVLSIPDYSATPFVPASFKAGVSAELDAMNDINRRISLQYGVSYTDVNPISKTAATDPSLIAYDMLHPSAKQYALWVALLAPEVYKALK